MKPSKTPTLADVGKAAGVSRGTVSNVFNHPELVRADLRQRVQDVARQMGYGGPDPRGRLLQNGRFNAIGLVPPGNYIIADMIRSPYGRELMLGVSLACDAAGATLSLVSGLDVQRASTLRDALVDGFVLGHVADIGVIRSVQRRNLPFVILESDPGPDINSIRIDGRHGARLAVRHLAALGHTRFAILSVRRTAGPPVVHPPGTPITEGFALDHERMQGFTDGLTAAGLSIRDMPIIETVPGEPQAGAAVFDHAHDATAVLTMSDWQAITVLEEARRRGISVPGDVSVVGCDGTAAAARTTPPLTTVSHDIVGKGRLAAELILANQAPRQIVLPVELVIRASTAPPKA